MSEPIKKCSEWPLLTQSEVNEFLRTLPQFTLLRDSSSTDGKIINKLRIKFLTINFVAALEFIQQAGLVAEAQGHHPGMT